ncbi:hypothetical protein [Alkalilimnicola sp. S0819]|uniref:hypothetical protein n=1 Tax=Alkalilimnicola sp. S0819 TaxID=2613922 RepID=UPI00186A1365|nr:hypothetical protein [Alkalilimnicola sp. S0819]
MSDEPRHQSEYDPRPVTDAEGREKHSREQVQKWREEAQQAHNAWMDVMNNRYGQD